MKIYLLIILLTIPNLICARKITEQKIEPAIAEITYSRKMALDTLNILNDFKIQNFTLKVGLNTSAFYSAELKTRDSLEYRHRELILARYDDPNSYKMATKLPPEVVYKNFPARSITTLDRFDFCHWLIEEEWEMPKWNITDSVSNLHGYNCILATTNYRGRVWRAWFTPDIPIPEGPWKLCGLPGLILKATDAKDHYLYEALSIKTSNVGDVEYYDYDAGNRLISKNRKESLSRKHKYLHTDVRYKILSSGAYEVNNPNVKERKIIPHTNYDFEETDYPHN